MSKSINPIDYCINHPSVNGIIADLKMMVEKLHLEFTKLREIIQELAEDWMRNRFVNKRIFVRLSRKF